MIEILTANTPNGKKITIMCEEIGFEYKITKINIYKDEQFNPKFRAISPFSKIPVIIDHENNTSLFESGAILMYLGEKSGKFYPEKNKHLINQWLMGQMAYVGPMLGQHHQFHHYNPGKSEWGEDRYFKIAKSIYKDLDDRLEKSKFLAGDYSIADMATFPWIVRHEWHDIGLKNFKNLCRWYEEISKRKAVIKGFDLLNRDEKIPGI
jgi:GST-like protein